MAEAQKQLGSNDAEMSAMGPPEIDPAFLRGARGLAHAGRVLNVNDDDVSLDTVSLMLRRAGFDVIEARTGEAALRAAEECRPDVMVLDIHLHDLDGFEVCQRVRENPSTSYLKVLHTSARFAAQDSKLRSLAGGADSYLTQPFEPEELVATVRALLKLRLAEQELRDVAAQLRETDRRKNEFLAMLGHELRNPLAAITSSLPVVTRRAPCDEVESRAYAVLTRQTRHLTRMVDDLLDVARVTQGKVELHRRPVDLRGVLRLAVDNARHTRIDARRQTLELHLPDESVCVNGDATRLEQVVSNLIDNASKYTPDGGYIRVWLELRGEPGARQARLEVDDDGGGIAPDMLPKIFTLFSQAEVPIARPQGGLGVGLTLVRSIVDLHGGTVSATSKGRDAGSQFVVLLPAIDEAPAPDQARGPKERRSVERRAPPAVHKRRVLLVDDNLDALDMLQGLLSLWGHDVSGAPDGLSAVDKALELLPDVSLIDIGLPGIDGYEVARRIRADPKGRGLKLVALTGYGAPEERARAREAGFDQHIVKPVAPDTLAKLLAEG